MNVFLIRAATVIVSFHSHRNPNEDKQFLLLLQRPQVTMYKEERFGTIICTVSVGRWWGSWSPWDSAVK